MALNFFGTAEGMQRVGTDYAQQYQTTRRVPEGATTAPKPQYGPAKRLAMWSGPVNQQGACGVANLYSFQTPLLSDYDISHSKRLEDAYTKQMLHSRSGGCGFLSAAFIDTVECKIMYQQLKEWYPVLYQSPIRFNVNSGNNFFFCIFDTGEKTKPAMFTDEDHEDYDEDHVEGFPNGLEW